MSTNNKNLGLEIRKRLGEKKISSSRVAMENGFNPSSLRAWLSMNKYPLDALKKLVSLVDLNSNLDDLKNQYSFEVSYSIRERHKTDYLDSFGVMKNQNLLPLFKAVAESGHQGRVLLSDLAYLLEVQSGLQSTLTPTVIAELLRLRDDHWHKEVDPLTQEVYKA